MKQKIKHRSSSRKLQVVGRLLGWVGWIGIALSVFRALETYRQHSMIHWSGAPEFHTFYYTIWVPFIGALLVFLLSFVPSATMILISRLLRWGLRLKEENASQAELIEQLIEEQRERDIPAYLVEQDENDDMLPDTVYEKMNRQR